MVVDIPVVPVTLREMRDPPAATPAMPNCKGFAYTCVSAKVRGTPQLTEQEQPKEPQPCCVFNTVERGGE